MQLNTSDGRLLSSNVNQERPLHRLPAEGARIRLVKRLAGREGHEQVIRLGQRRHTRLGLPITRAPLKGVLGIVIGMRLLGLLVIGLLNFARGGDGVQAERAPRGVYRFERRHGNLNRANEYGGSGPTQRKVSLPPNA